MEIKARSLNELVLRSFEALYNHGEQIPSRNGGARSLYNVRLELSNPRNRHLYLNGRTNNIFQMIAETFWVMSGDDNIKDYLEFFLPRAPQYSDDGEKWYGAYGPRLYGYNQLGEVIETFKNDGKHTRRAVISIYQPDLDSKEGVVKNLGKETSLDRPCNNLLYFYITPDNKFHLHVTQRSGDALFGALSINVFEFTYLQEVMFNHVKQMYPEIELGSYSHYINNLHVYDQFADQMKDVLENYYTQLTGENTTNPLPPVKEFTLERKMYEALVNTMKEFITSDDYIYEEVKSDCGLIMEENFKFFDHESIIWKYVELCLAFIETKKRGLKKGEIASDITVDISSVGKEMQNAIEHSVFRKFEIIK